MHTGDIIILSQPGYTPVSYRILGFNSDGRIFISNNDPSFLGILIRNCNGAYHVYNSNIQYSIDYIPQEYLVRCPLNQNSANLALVNGDSIMLKFLISQGILPIRI